MLSINSAQWDVLVASFLWPFMRIFGVLLTEPVLASTAVPVRVRIGLAIAISIAVSGAIGPLPDVAPSSPAGLLILAQQLVIGLSIGFVMRIVLTAIESAGNIIGLQMGLGFATFFDPQNSAQVPVIGQFMGLWAMLLFLAMNGHLMVIATLVDSFAALPIGATSMGPGALETMVQWGGQIFVTGVLLSLPVVAALLVTNVGIAVMTRAAPQLNIFAVGFPLTLAVGFLVLSFVMPALAPLIEKLHGQGLSFALEVLRVSHRLVP